MLLVYRKAASLNESFYYINIGYDYVYGAFSDNKIPPVITPMIVTGTIGFVSNSQGKVVELNIISSGISDKKTYTLVLDNIEFEEVKKLIKFEVEIKGDVQEYRGKTYIKPNSIKRINERRTNN